MNKNNWYIINIITKYESNILKKIYNILLKKKNKKNRIYSFIKKKIKYRNNKQYIYTKRLLPGYLIVNLDLNNLLLYKIKKINGVIGFLNERENKLPIPLNNYEIKRFIKKNKKRYKIKLGDIIKINYGIFKGISGKVKKISKNKLEVLIYIMGRELKLKIDKTNLYKK